MRMRWTDRRFNFGIPPGWLPNVLCRLTGTQPRMLYIAHSISDEKASSRLNGNWSIKEHIGHLGDLEQLHIGRLQDFRDQKQALSPADMSNKATESADHNVLSMEELIQRFSIAREQLIRELSGLETHQLQHKILHERLQQEMSPVDMAFFTAEHDDHHIQTINEIIHEIN